MINALSSALTGLNNATTQINGAATQVAQSGPSADASVSLIEGETSYKADIAVMKTTIEMENQLAHIFDQTV